jgi:predicted CoA-binding protein
MSTQSNFLGDPSHDVLRAEPNPLDVIFRPKSIAVIGATEREGSVGRTVVENLLKGGFAGTLCGVNPHRREVLGVPTYPSLADAPGKVDLAVVVTPAATVPSVVRECGAAGVGGAVIISAGFKEIRIGRCAARARGARGGAPWQSPARRAELPGGDQSFRQAQRNVRAVDGPRRLRGPSQPERRAVHGYSRLEPAGKCRLQRIRFHWLDADFHVTLAEYRAIRIERNLIVRYR